jgi:predicted transcriptional regulator
VTLLFSIAPRWVDLILAGEKRFELRRRPPRNLAMGTPALLYATAPTSAIIAKVQLGEVVTADPDVLWERIGAWFGCSRDYYDAYFAGAAPAHAICLLEPMRLAEPISLRRMATEYGLRPPQSWMSISTNALSGDVKCFS